MMVQPIVQEDAHRHIFRHKTTTGASVCHSKKIVFLSGAHVLDGLLVGRKVSWSLGSPFLSQENAFDYSMG